MQDALPVGTKIAGFVLDAPLGQGGFGITYRARSQDGAGDYAIKEYFPSDFARRAADGIVLPRDGKEAARNFEIGRKAFLEEAFILRDLPRQPGLVRVRGAFEKLGTAYCLMDYVAGDPLDVFARLRAQSGELPDERQLRKLIVTLCRALSAVHKTGFIHRDVKPSNIIMTASGAPVLIDFGAARRIGQGRGLGSMLSRKYGALEQFPGLPRSRTGGQALIEGPWTDLFALSVVLYEWISQSVPPPADLRAEEQARSGSDPYVPVRQMLRRNRVETVHSDTLLALIDRGCALMPKDRPQTALDYCRPIERMGPLPGGPSAGPTPPPLPGASEEVAASARPRPVPHIQSDGPRSDRAKIVTMLLIILGIAIGATLFGLIPQEKF
ncbi:serine/threonine-protein kinase [Rhodobacter capsulatus]|uniref:Serine/threonine protein kinase n=1 Tax=Rhodobacter capsulatus TaxID=1061 RepID=A0A1G7CUV3_RHOCA|nr:serine/threonine-protein kinase [Rhodobacter capsulatus]WER10776.1 serine/threonine-protein kinase [Rhodobacter capsulatus]SDE42285.1 Serine/threonine protein kinase [Rhodobacter capsulatus]